MSDVVCVTGASSQLGVFLLPRLCAAGYRVLAVSRRAPPEGAAIGAGLLWRPPAGLDDWRPAHLVSCGPLALALEIVRAQPGLRRVVAFSSSSVLSKAASGDDEERLAMSAMADDETALEAACEAHGLPLLLLRPTLIYGCGRDRNVSLLARLAARFGVIPLAGPAAGLRQPVHADDLAALAVAALAAAEPLRLDSAACGGETLPYREMAGRIAAAQSRRVRLVTLPESLMATGVGLLSRLPAWRGLNAEMVRRQNRDLVFDDTGLRRLLGWAPRAFRPTAADFRIPDDAALLQLD